jgi:parallel beta helix pectate lyase-like protein
MRYIVTIATILGTMAGVAAAERIPVTACGQEIAGAAELVGDLDCSGSSGPGVKVVRGRLFLNGFTITGPSADAAVFCEDGPVCRVLGPGSLAGGEFGIVSYATNLTVRDVTITGTQFAPIFQTRPRLILRGSTITGNGRGISSGDMMRVTDSSITDNGATGIVADRVRVRDSTVTGNGGDLSQCGAPQLCVDVFSYFPPHLVNTVCGTSVGPPPAFLTWGVCQDD